MHARIIEPKLTKLHSRSWFNFYLQMKGEQKPDLLDSWSNLACTWDSRPNRLSFVLLSPEDKSRSNF